MNDESLAKLTGDLETSIASGVSSFGIIGEDPLLLRIGEWHRSAAPGCDFVVYGSGGAVALAAGLEFRPIRMIVDDRPDVVIVAADSDKERVIDAALPYLSYAPKLIVAGYGHYEFRDELFEKIRRDLLVASIANGYPNTLVHLYECLVNAARRDLDGAVVEFGTFRGGTTMFLAKVVKSLDRDWPVLSFDTFEGFPSRRSALDMYTHEGAEFHNVEAVRAYLAPVGVKLIEGDIAETARTLSDTPIVLAFIDTDNYTPAAAAIEAIRDYVIPGGAIVFDHYSGVARFRSTLGERIAAKSLKADGRYFNLHATGVFLRQY